MEQSFPTLKVEMLGRFSMTYGEQSISFKRNTMTKAMKLLQILLYTSGTGDGIPRTLLLEELYGKEEISNAANSLRVTAHRLKKMILEAGLPDYDYIQIKKGIYRWEAPMEISIDAVEFEKLVEEGKQEEDKEKSIEAFCKACRLYRGVFLPALSGEDWVLINSVKYKELYQYALSRVCEYKKEQREYEIILELTDAAVEIYPFDEWQCVKMEALMALNRYKEAYQYYEETSKMFFEELGISPSEKMMNVFKEMSDSMGRTYQVASEIKESLSEGDTASGAFYCTLPSFRDSYRIIRRIIERNGHSVFLMVCSLVDYQGRPIEKKEKLEVLSKTLHESIQTSLRRGDSFTKYSPTQFLILLIGTNRENCSIIYKRILDKFSAANPSWRKNLEYCAFSVADMEGQKTAYRFEDNKFNWK